MPGYDPGCERPWGRFEILLDCGECKVKRITVSPGMRTSLQKHARRSEHWFVTGGEGTVFVHDREIAVLPGVAVQVPANIAHRLHNTGNVPLSLIEIQTGDYFGEDDIERMEDDFGR